MSKSVLILIEFKTLRTQQQISFVLKFHFTQWLMYLQLLYIPYRKYVLIARLLNGLTSIINIKQTSNVEMFCGMINIDTEIQ